MAAVTSEDIKEIITYLRSGRHNAVRVEDVDEDRPSDIGGDFDFEKMSTERLQSIAEHTPIRFRAYLYRDIPEFKRLFDEKSILYTPLGGGDMSMDRCSNSFKFLTTDPEPTLSHRIEKNAAGIIEAWRKQTGTLSSGDSEASGNNPPITMDTVAVVRADLGQILARQAAALSRFHFRMDDPVEFFALVTKIIRRFHNQEKKEECEEGEEASGDGENDKDPGGEKGTGKGTGKGDKVVPERQFWWFETKNTFLRTIAGGHVRFMDKDFYLLSVDDTRDTRDC